MVGTRPAGQETGRSALCTLARTATRIPPEQGSQPLASLSRELVQLLRRRAGRGPTHARIFSAHEDVLLALFEGGYTKPEQTLWGRGRPDTALAYRRAVLDSLDADLRQIVEDCIGRRVKVILSSVHHEPDVMAIVLLLEPAGVAPTAIH